ncbi:MAG TPA: YggS family pyridoxal phosphate-dependent enzyme [Anaerolineales bacterium]|nr:YggS family pyridoxal phosphate-dependent enzyme [Anaerolineales bacterium]
MTPPQVDAIRVRLESVQRRIAEAAWRSGREPVAVRLVTVTKGHSVETIRAAFSCGLRAFGENRVEEALPKMAALADLNGVEWHLIGPLQSRKVQLVGTGFTLIHAVDRLKIARRLHEHALGVDRPQPVLLECNVSGESSKAGWRLDVEASWESVLGELREISRLPGLSVRGLMTMAPLGADSELQREAFRRLARLQEFLAARLGCALPELSMGMSDDFEVAVEAGATLVRIGRAILGERM